MINFVLASHCLLNPACLDDCSSFFFFFFLEPIREVWIHDEAFAASRLSMMRIMARRTKAATVIA